MGQDCTLLNQTTLIANELWTTQMNLTGYVSSSPVVKTCGIYQLSGQYVSTDYLTRTWVGLGVNHYKLVIRFSIGFIGTFAGNEAYQVTINGGTSSTNHTFQYACTVFANICNAGGTSSDCFYNYEAVASHATDQLTIKFTALTSQTNPLVQFWGVKDLLVVAFTCSPVCMTCTNPTNCVSCPPRSYLIGSSCVKNCPFLSVPSLRTCVTACPTGYFLNSLNSFCEECPNGCMMCSALSTCQAWTPEANPHNTFYDHISLWIVLLAISVSVLGLVIWTHFKKPPLQSIP